MLSCLTRNTMRDQTNYSFLISLFFLTLPFLCSSSCTSRCGGMEIPFPFGIGKNCSLNEWYEIDCRTDFPFLAKLGMEVVNISLPSNYGNSYSDRTYSTVRVKHPITSMGCSSNGEEFRSALNLTGSPYFFGEGNSLVTIGCDTMAWLTNAEPNTVGCESTCTTGNNSQSILFLDNPECSRSGEFPADYIPVCNTTKRREDTICYGNGCCQASAPSTAQQLIGVTIANINNGNLTAEQECKVAFLTDEVHTLSNATNPELHFIKRYATVNLGWFIQTKNHSFRESLDCRNRNEFENLPTQEEKLRVKCICDNNTISGISYANCACRTGYRGNPYLRNHCEDIDECVELIKPCNDHKACKNTQGHHECIEHHLPEIMTGFGTGMFVLILGVGIWWLRKFLKKRRIIRRKRKFFKRNGGLLLQQKLHTTQGNVEKTKIFSSRELEKATENFSISRVIGQGGQGTVYKGMLVDGQSVAVKKTNVVDEDKLQEFINEVIILSQINHRHVVKLLGCCLETEVPVLVYEFITNGNLFQHLHEEFDDYTVLWGVRMRIAVDIAGAFSYLHSAASSPIYHRDIKSTNILLDEKYRAKVSDFGTSRSVTIDHTHWTTVISGTVGYVDPEYYGSSHFTEKSDVYSFGVVLAELITGEKPVITLSNTQEITGLADYFRLAMKENRLFDIIDAQIKNDCKLEQVIAVANLAIRCLKKTGKNRPDMREIATELERICSSPEDFQVQIQIDGDENLYRDGSWSSVTTRTNVM